MTAGVERPETLADWKALNARLALLLEQMRANVEAGVSLVDQLPVFRQALAVAIAAEVDPKTIDGIRLGIRRCESLAQVQSSRDVKSRPVKRRWWRR